MDELTDVTHDPPAAEELTLVALTPADMVPAQAELSAWCVRKLAAVTTELADLETNLELATQHGWKHASVEASLNRAAKRVTYYEKMKAAIDAGYLIVPNFPIDVFAVRVARRKQPEKVYDNNWASNFAANQQLLPAGEGRYVDNTVRLRNESHTAVVDGKEKHVRRYVSASYDAVDFPVLAVKPAILSTTQRAMALKIFDQMGTVTNQSGRDPIVVGQLLDPRGNGRRVTFFVAWWLDTASL